MFCSSWSNWLSMSSLLFGLLTISVVDEMADETPDELTEASEPMLGDGCSPLLLQLAISDGEVIVVDGVDDEAVWLPLDWQAWSLASVAIDRRESDFWRSPRKANILSKSTTLASVEPFDVTVATELRSPGTFDLTIALVASDEVDDEREAPFSIEDRCSIPDCSMSLVMLSICSSANLIGDGERGKV